MITPTVSELLATSLRTVCAVVLHHWPLVSLATGRGRTFSVSTRCRCRCCYLAAASQVSNRAVNLGTPQEARLKEG